MMKHIIIFLMFIAFIGCESNEKVDLKDRVDLSKAMGGTSDEDFNKAIEPRKFVRQTAV